jgi:hypothetical protein
MKAPTVAKTDISSPRHEFGDRERKSAARRNVDVDAGDEQQVLVVIGGLAPDTAIGAIELDLGMVSRGIERGMAGSDQCRHGGGKRRLKYVVAFRFFGDGAAEEEEIGSQVTADDLRLVAPGFRRDAFNKGGRGAKNIRCASGLQQAGAAIDQQVEVQEQAFGPIFVKELIADENGRLTAEPAAEDVFAGVTIFELVLVQHRAELSAIVAELLAGGALPLIDAEPLGIGVVADMACLDNDEIFAVMGVRPVPIERNIAADQAVIEREGSEVLGDQNDRIALTLVGAERARRHHPLAAESKRQAIVVQPWDELAVAHRVAVKLQILDETLH